MGQSIKIDYENIPTQSNNIVNIAQQINTKLVNVYDKVAEMHEHWYGKSYNQLALRFNELVPQLNEFLKVIVVDVPYTLSAVSNDISNVDIKQNITAAHKENVETITEIPIIDDVVMRYIADEVTMIQEQIVTSLRSAYELTENMEGVLNKVTLECSNSAEFKQQLNKLINAFKQLVSQIETQFTELMNENKKQLENVEEANSGQ